MPHNNQEALKHLAGELRLEGLQFSSEGLCELEIGEQTVALWGQPEETALRLSGVAGNLPDSDSPAALRLLLHANYLGQGTGRSTLSLDPVTYEVVLNRVVEVGHLDPGGLVPALEEFVNHLSFWNENLDRLVTEAQREEPAAAAAIPVSQGGMRV